MKNTLLKMFMVSMVAMVSFIFGCIFMALYLYESRQMKMYTINEPLQILGNDDGEYFLPVGTVLYHEDSFAEGHSLYWTPFYHKGKIDMEERHLEKKHMGRLIVPQWLENLSVD